MSFFELKESSFFSESILVLEKEHISKSVFKTFDLAVDFFNLVANAANAQNHHPDILSSYCTIEISLTTHDKRKITEKDLILASKIDELFGNFNGNEK